MKEKKIQQKNNLNIFFNEYFSVIIFLLAVAIFLFSYIFVLAPKLKTTTTLIGENIAMQKKLYGEQEKRLNELKTIKKVYDEILPSDLEKFNQILPSDYIKESLFGDFEEIVIKHGFLLKDVTLEILVEEETKPSDALPGGQQIVTSPNVGKVRAIIAVNALDYSGFKRMLKSLEASARLFDIENLGFSQEKGSAQFELVTYYYKDMSLK
jgi:hypothetical protein